MGCQCEPVRARRKRKRRRMCDDVVDCGDEVDDDDDVDDDEGEVVNSDSLKTAKTVPPLSTDQSL